MPAASQGSYDQHCQGTNAMTCHLQSSRQQRLLDSSNVNSELSGVEIRKMYILGIPFYLLKRIFENPLGVPVLPAEKVILNP